MDFPIHGQVNVPTNISTFFSNQWVLESDTVSLLPYPIFSVASYRLIGTLFPSLVFFFPLTNNSHPYVSSPTNAPSKHIVRYLLLETYAQTIDIVQWDSMTVPPG